MEQICVKCEKLKEHKAYGMCNTCYKSEVRSQMLLKDRHKELILLVKIRGLVEKAAFLVSGAKLTMLEILNKAIMEQMKNEPGTEPKVEPGKAEWFPEVQADQPVKQ
jgi:hypothetical protein